MSCGNDDDSYTDPVVVDNGSWMIKAGYAGDKTARVYVPTVVGKASDETPCSHQMSHIGDKINCHSVSSVVWPLKCGAVENWDKMEEILDYVFLEELQNGVKDRPMLITEVPGNKLSNRQKMVEILIEKYEIQSLYVIDPASLALIASGRITGVVLDIGGSTTHVAALYNGKNLQTAETNEASHKSPWRSDIGGNDVTRYLQHLIGHKQNVDSNVQSSDLQFLDIDELKATLATQIQGDTTCKQFSLKHGGVIEIDKDLLRCSDVLFEAKLAGLDCTPVDELLKDAINCCDESIKAELYTNVILSGGATMQQGVVERICDSLKRDTEYDVKVIAPPERRKSSWLGGSIIASLDIFPSMYKSRQTYFENGVAEFNTFPGLECLKPLS